jgi:hypothetical protein
MNMRPFFLIIIAVAFLMTLPLAMAESAQPMRSHLVEHPDGGKVSIEEQRKLGDTFDWQNSTPLDFLNYLKRHDKPIPVYTVVGFHKDWIRREDIPALIKLFDSKDPCASVVSAYSSFMPSRSTVGQEAAIMVHSFFSGTYPSGLNSHPVNKKKIIKQWEEYSTKK